MQPPSKKIGETGSPAKDEAEAQACYNSGNVLLDLDLPGEALGSYDQAVKLNPRLAGAHNNRGIALELLGRPQEALASYRCAIRLKPDFAMAQYNCANVLVELGRPQEALPCFAQAVAAKPDYADAYNNRGNALKGLGRLDEALASYEQAIAADRGYALAHYNRGNLLLVLGRLEEALASCEQAIGLDPDYAPSHYCRGRVLQGLGRLEEALAGYGQALALQPDHGEAHNNLGNVLRSLKRMDEALASYDRAIAANPHLLVGHYNRGVALLGAGRPEDALVSLERAIELGPEYAAAHSSRGKALQDLNRLAEADESYERAIALQPDLVHGHYNRALCRLLMGDFARGWEEYEWRWQEQQFEVNKRDFTQPTWLGKESVRGKTILLHSEQGLGDTLQFCRYAPLVGGLGANVVLEVQKPLLGLMGSLDGVDQVVAKNDGPLPPFDCHCPLMSLPLALGTELDTVPAPEKYLSSDDTRVAAWHSRLGPKTKPRVGLAWSGNPQQIADRYRSIALAALAPLLTPDIEWFSLHRDAWESDAAALAAHPEIRHFGDEMDFDATAAVIELMDLVISVDTSLAHLVGALGKPVWILLPFSPDWRWLLDREDSPWYPIARLFRQETPGDWPEVLQRVGAALEAWKKAANPESGE